MTPSNIPLHELVDQANQTPPEQTFYTAWAFQKTAQLAAIIIFIFFVPFMFIEKVIRR